MKVSLWSTIDAITTVLTRADIPITTPDFWVDEQRCTEEVLKHVFRSATDEEIPMFKERVQCLREAGEVLCEVRPPVSSIRIKLILLVGIRWQLCKLR